MARDKTIETIFTTADDAMQGLWGFHTYVQGALAVADPKRLISRLPMGKFKLTHEWERFYDRDELGSVMDNIGVDFLQSRASLVALVAIFEAAISRFNQRLSKLGQAPRKDLYKDLLKWTFSLVKASKAGSPTMVARLPETCGDVDNARRLRNTIVHNNGKYSEKYEKDAINDGWVTVRLENDWQRGAGCGNPVFITTARFQQFSWSHVELLHIVHNTIQRDYFQHFDDYNYALEGKAIEWQRVLSGRRVAGM